MSQPPRAGNPGADDTPILDQSNAPRVAAANVPAIKGVRLKPHGADAKLINISTTGMLTECTARIKVGSTVAVLFEGTFAVQSAVGRIVRCEVGAMGTDGVLRYHVAVAFNQPLAPDALPSLAPPPAPAPARVDPLDAPDPIAALAAASRTPAAAVRNRW